MINLAYDSASPKSELTIQLLRSKESAPQELTRTWEWLVALLTQVERTSTPKLELPGWAPCKLREPRRKAEYVEHVSVLALDFDAITAEQWQQTLKNLEGLSYAYCSSYSHKPISGELRYRVVVQLDRAVLANQWQAFITAAQAAFNVGPSAKAPHKQQPDEACSDAARFYFGSYCPVDGPEPESGVGHGQALPVDELLSQGANEATSTQDCSPLSHEDIRKILPKRIDRVENENTRTGWAALQRVLAGEPYALEGERDNTLLHMSGILSRHFSRRSAADIVAPIARALDDAHPDMGAEALIAKLERDLAQRRDEEMQRAAEHARAAGREMYSEAEIQRWMSELNVPTKEAFARQLILDFKGQFYVFYDGGYVEVGGKHKADNYVRQKLALAAIALSIVLGETTPKGYVQYSFSRLCELFSTTIECVSPSMRARHSRLKHEDGKGTTLIRPMYPGAGRDEPHCDPQLDQYLSIVAGSPERRAVLDAYLRATHPNATQHASPRALLLVGPSETGKSEIISYGVGLQYGDSGYSNGYKLLSGRFADAIERTPVVLVDEHAPRGCMDAFKALITDSEFKLEGKGRPEYRVDGAPIVVLACNDASRMLSELAGDKLVSPADAAAVARRATVIEIPTDAPETLRAAFGDHFHAFGVRCRSERLIPRYISWLAHRADQSVPDNHSKDRIVELLRANGGLSDLLLAHVADSLERQQRRPVANAVFSPLSPQGPACDAGVLVAGGSVWLNAKFIRDEWSSKASTRQPNGREVATAVEHLVAADRCCRVRRDGKQIEYRELNWGMLVRYLSTTGRDPGEFRMRVLALSLVRAAVAKGSDRTTPEQWREWNSELEALRSEGRADVQLASAAYEVATTERASAGTRLTLTPPRAA